MVIVQSAVRDVEGLRRWARVSGPRWRRETAIVLNTPPVGQTTGGYVPPETNNGSDGNECDCCSTGATAGARVGTILIFFCYVLAHWHLFYVTIERG